MNKNRFTSYVKKIPIIKHILPENPYSPNNSSKFIIVIQVLSAIFKLLMGNVYSFFLYGLPLLYVGDKFGSEYAIVWDLFATIIYAMIRALNKPSVLTGDLQANQSLISHIKVNAKTVALNSRYLYFIDTTLNKLILLAFVPNVFVFISIIILWLGTTLMVDVYYQVLYLKTKKVYATNVSSIYSGSLAVVMILMMVLLGWVANQAYLPIISIVPLFIISCVLLLSFFFISNKLDKNFAYYPYMTNYIRSQQAVLDSVETGTKLKEDFANKVELDSSDIQKGSGFVLLNNAFFSRHKKLWRKRLWITNLVFVAIIIVLIGLYFFGNTFNIDIGSIIEEKDQAINGIGVFLILVYYLNFGETLTNALFYNCDSSLLGYRMYNTGRNVLLNFLQRLKHFIRLHLVQTILFALTITIGLLTFELINDYSTLAFVFIAFFFGGIFFCIHSLVIYYLLQPYNVDLKMTGISYSVVNIATYFVVYSFSKATIDIHTLSLTIMIFCGVYFIIASLLVYNFAPLTFKIKK